MGQPVVALFGAGSLGRSAVAALAAAGLRAACIFDNDRTRWGQTFEGLPLRAPTREAFVGVDVVWITSMYATEIARQLADLGVAARVVTQLDEVHDVVSGVDRPSTGPAQPLPPPGRTRRPAVSVDLVVADRGWILERMAQEIASRLPYTRVVDAPTGRVPLTYYINYSARRGPVPGREIAFFTHVEDDVPAAADRFFAAGREVDVAIAMAPRYAERLRANGARDVRVIAPGVDLERFRPIVRIGVVGRTYHTGRKGEALVAAVIDEPGIEWCFTGEGWPRPGRPVADADLPAFYRSLDYVLVPARYEGGPMCVLEALACGVEVIAPDIGFVELYPHIPYATNDAEDLRRVLRELVAQKAARHEAVAHRTWDAWALEHDRVFTERLAVEPAPEDAARVTVPADAPASPAASAVASVSTATRPLRVLLALHAPEIVTPTGGPSIRVRRMQDALASFGVQADLATTELPDVSGYDLVHAFNVWEPESARRQLAHFRASGRPVVFSPILLDLFEGLWAQRAMLPVLRSGRGPQYIEAELDKLQQTPMDVRRALGACLSPLWETWPATVRDLVSLADHVLVLSARETALLAEFGALGTPITVVHNGVDADWPASDGGAAFRHRVGVGDYVLCVGRVEPRKNQALLAWALRDTGLDLVLLGDTPKPDYQAVVQALGGARVHFVPRVSHDDPLLASAYAGARVFALPSWSEGMPLSALEAAASGAALVLSNRSGERETLGPLARYCDPSDWRDIRRAVLEAWHDADRPGRRREARAWIGRALTWEHAARTTALAYARTLGARGIAPEDWAPPPSRAIEIGSGQAPLAGHEHLDARPDLPEIDHVADIRAALPFPDATFDHLSSRNCLEHVPWREVRAVLGEWARVLRPGGTLDLRMPDFEYLCRAYLDGHRDGHLEPGLQQAAATALGRYDASAWAIVKMFGGQDYPENFHGAVLDEAVLARLLDEVGFEAIQRKEPLWCLRLTARRRQLPAARRPLPAPPDPRELVGASVPALHWDGPFFNLTGYAALGRHVARALLDAGVSVQLTSRDDDRAVRAQMLSADETDGPRWQQLVRRTGAKDVYVSCYTPADWEGVSNFARRRERAPGYRAYVGLSMFECDRVVPAWVNGCRHVDELWVPSRFARDVFVESGVPAYKVRVMPVGLDAARYDPARLSPLPVAGRRTCLFLSVFDWSLRKGWDVLVEAWANAFKAADDVCLVLRTASRRKDESPDAAIDAHLARIGRTRRDVAPIIVLTESLSDEEMARLYVAADVFVLPTRGEGWGLPLMEAMAAGVPVIATRWSGHLDFVTEDTGWLIDVDGLNPVDPAQAARSPFYSTEQRWADPSVAHTARLMRRAFEHPELRRRKGDAARAAVRTEWTPGRTVQWIRSRLADLAPDADEEFARARALEAAGDVDRAAAAYARAAELRPGWDLPTYNRASLLKQAGRRDEARPLFAALAGEPSGELAPGAAFHLGELEAAVGETDAARQHFAQCVARIPRHKAAGAWLAYLDARDAERRDDLAVAAAGYDRARTLRPDWWLAHYNLASVLERRGDSARAASIFADVARRAGEAGLRAGSHFHLARLFAAQGDRARARGHADSALVEQPSHGAAQVLRASLEDDD